MVDGYYVWRGGNGAMQSHILSLRWWQWFCVMGRAVSSVDDDDEDGVLMLFVWCASACLYLLFRKSVGLFRGENVWWCFAPSTSICGSRHRMFMCLQWIFQCNCSWQNNKNKLTHQYHYDHVQWMAFRKLIIRQKKKIFWKKNSIIRSIISSCCWPTSSGLKSILLCRRIL